MGSSFFGAEARSSWLNLLYPCFELQTNGALPRFSILLLFGRSLLERENMVGVVLSISLNLPYKCYYLLYFFKLCLMFLPKFRNFYIHEYYFYRDTEMCFLACSITRKLCFLKTILCCRYCARECV